MGMFGGLAAGFLGAGLLGLLFGSGLFGGLGGLLFPIVLIGVMVWFRRSRPERSEGSRE